MKGACGHRPRAGYSDTLLEERTMMILLCLLLGLATFAILAALTNAVDRWERD
jgi:hypothetical protein